MSTAAKTELELEVGHFAPDFSVPTDGAGAFDLSKQRGKKNIVLYFYPKDDTPGCTTEAKDFTAMAEKFAQLDTLIVGISKDTVAKHDKFKAKHELNVILGSDETESVCEAYGTWVEKNMYGRKYMGIQRDTFLIDKEGKLAKIWRKVKVKDHAEEVLKSVEAL